MGGREQEFIKEAFWYDIKIIIYTILGKDL
jgi:hypothetical protein